MFKKRQAKAGGARKQTPQAQATSSTTSAPSLLSFGADEDEGPTFEVKKRKLKQKKKRKENPAPTQTPPSSSDYSAAGLAALRGRAGPAGGLLEGRARAAEGRPAWTEEAGRGCRRARARRASRGRRRAPRPKSRRRP